MKDQEFKDIWRSLENSPGLHSSERLSAGQFKNHRSLTINDKIRKILKKDLFIKIAYGLVLLIDIFYYINDIHILYTCLGLFLILSFFSILQYRILQDFIRISDPSLSAGSNLSQLLVFLQRRKNILGILSASAAYLAILPVMLLYFYFTYGGLRPLIGMDFFVFGSVTIVGSIMLYSKMTSQIRYYIQHVTVCMSDLDETILQYAYSSIEKERKKDSTLKLVISLMSFFAIVVIVAVIYSIK